MLSTLSNVVDRQFHVITDGSTALDLLAPVQLLAQAAAGQSLRVPTRAALFLEACYR